MTIEISSAQEAAFNAAGEAMHELELTMNLGRDPKWKGEGSQYCASASVPGVPGQAQAAIADTAAEAVAELIRKVNDVIANPPPKVIHTAAEAKRAVEAIVEEARSATVYPAELDGIADRIAALPVKE